MYKKFFVMKKFNRFKFFFFIIFIIKKKKENKLLSLAEFLTTGISE